ncbi:metallophosphoesterase [Bradyrhizobium genosp. L]|uniref:metallophosphoesterase family protein n=1 Tax=Bradyrhizobium genosp. L TaxID=83637 RepID=UPI0018A2B5F4|nr:metallophosphoesterase [Bradyrhizobium genosp. L]QPF82602.1 metallophosphoesterase [Bradyrhizobium genosp. L]
MTMHHLIPNPNPGANPASRFAKTRRAFLEPISNPKNNPHFEKPPLTNNVNLVLPLRVILPGVAAAAAAAKKLVFHVIGDSGGIHGDDVQVAVAEAMEGQIKSASGADAPSFLYHVGDVVYFNGQSELYGAQFYEPYQYYPAPIFAIPGNHDGDTRVRSGDTPDSEPSLFGFMENFCAPQAHQIGAYRATMTQPYVYWMLEAPLVTVIGLYSNVEGTLDARGAFEQQRWLEEQLLSVKKSDGFIVIAVHHPPYSLDKTHGGYPDIVASLDQAMEHTGVIPHAVLSGHVHNMQRFTRRYKNRQIPYIIDGRGGYANNDRLAHKLQKSDAGEYPTAPVKAVSTQDKTLDLDLDYYDQDSAGFLRVTVTTDKLTIDSFSVPFTGGEFDDVVRDSVTVKRDGTIDRPPPAGGRRKRR